MSLSLTQQLFDVGSLGTVGLSGSDLTNLPELARKLGYDYVAMYGLYMLGADEQVFSTMNQFLPEQAAAPASTVALAGMSSILGAELRRLVPI